MMKKPEIDCRLDEIANSAEVEQFLNTLLKRYYTGMQVRLAFACSRPPGPRERLGALSSDGRHLGSEL